MTKKRKRALVGPSLEVDRRIRFVGRIRHASGLAVPSQFALLNAAITESAKTDDGRAILRAMVGKQPKLRADVFWQHYKTATLHLIPLGNAAADLRTALETWRETTKADVASDTYRTRKELLTRVGAVAAPDATVSALPDVLRVLRVRMKGARQFNYVRDYARAFLRDTLGKTHAVYTALVDVPPRPTKVKVKKHPLSPVEVRQIAIAFATVRTDRIAASTAARGVRPIEASGDDTIAMALTGMNPKEYAGSWQVRDHHLHIDGTKQEGRDRDIPKVFPCALWPHRELPVPSVGPKNYWRWFKAAATRAGIRCTPYDLRRTFANWMESAGIPRTRRKLYMGHGAADVTDLYERHEVTAYLIRDGKQLRAWIATQLPKESRHSRKAPRVGDR